MSRQLMGGDSILLQSPATGEQPSALYNPDSPALWSAVAGETELSYQHSSTQASLLARDLLSRCYSPAPTKTAHLLFSTVQRKKYL